MNFDLVKRKDTVSNFLFSKNVDWSLLNECGFNIPIVNREQIKANLSKNISRGESIGIKILFDGKVYEALLKNQSFDERKYPDHADLLQIRFSRNSGLAVKLREIFKLSNNLILKKREERGRHSKHIIKLKKEEKETLHIYQGTSIDNFTFVPMMRSERNDLLNDIKDISEQDFESIVNMHDPSAGISVKPSLVKIRELDRYIGENLKKFYDFRCQICGIRFDEKYAVQYAEAHHIDHFVKSLNNDSRNIIILCPNHHRIIHKANPEFSRRKKCFRYPNGLEERIMIDNHLFVK